MQAARKRDLPLALQSFNDADVSSACSDIAMPQTTTTSTTSTLTVTQTTTATTTTTSEIPRTTTTSAVTTTTFTTFPEDTSTILTTTPTVTTTTTTAYAVATECASVVVDNTYPSNGDYDRMSDPSLTQDSCCRACFDAPGCGSWFYGPGYCALGRPSDMSTISTECPAGKASYQLVSGNSFVTGEGPCSSGFIPPQ
ncbi:hypothetical protein C8R46DRAFT_1083011 [Mycena filopes]|nr:hypothetical protein C8R46DRAFT_1083011 [Mycena filopes]